jgi:trehalose 6-phosphate phosphatase
MSMSTLESANVLRQIAGVVSQAVIAVDFDGTVTPISPHPADSVPNQTVLDQLSRLARTGARIAVITGRSATSAVEVGRLAQIPGVVVEGLYGAERWHDGNLATRQTPEGVLALRVDLPPLVARLVADPQVWIEDKRLSLVVHARLTKDPDAVLGTLREPISKLAREHGMEVRPGAEVLEICIPGIDKASAVRRLVNDETEALVYIGDDVGDLPAFAAVRQWRERTGRPGLVVGVVPGPDSPIAGVADLEVSDTHAVGVLLAALAPVPDLTGPLS